MYQTPPKAPRKRLVIALFLILSLLLAACGTTPQPGGQSTPPSGQGQNMPAPANPDLILATTTSTTDSGLLDVLIPAFEKKRGYKVKPLSVGTGQALAYGEKGEADVLLVHAPDAELKVVEKGAAINRKLVMHNDFIVVGPSDDPAGVKGLTSTVEALKKIAGGGKLFISRGDDSGTHKMEKSFWQKASLTPTGNAWYQETGAGMGQTLNVASEKQGYTLTDRATYLAQKKNLKLAVVLEKEPALLNIYHVMEVNAEKFPKVNKEGAKAFSDFLLSAEGQEMIKTFGVDKYGEPLFVPDAGKKEETLGK
ncbi:solute-binding protein [Heliobacterium gestii]|uniref:Solute-binding protein n=1 Tax=Heliomicrobium gestii TaxID=2699 RepID=A0A845LD01_HELGE|nr:substrate-binding domain-containing protein [Heliomicrobium gestii]MBM7865174.1 tungstate transport system substrate-binding protein [Heliomicrobium gestii]MZP41443.1 solute-binding protein [Heliomicrobium gestii]